MQPYPVQGQPMVATTCVVAQPVRNDGTRPTYNTNCSKCLGATQIAIGIACVIFQIVAIAIHAGLAFVGHGIWCGIFYILAGAFGVAARNKRSGMIITFMVLSILSASLFVIPLITCASIGLSFDNYYYRYSDYSPYFTPVYDKPIYTARRVMNGLMIGLALLEGIIAIISASICCGPLCCPGQTGTVHQPGGQMVVVTVPAGSAAPQPGQAMTYVQQMPPAGGQPYLANVPQQAVAPPTAQAQEPIPPPYNPELNPPPYQEKV